MQPACARKRTAQQPHRSHHGKADDRVGAHHAQKALIGQFAAKQDPLGEGDRELRHQRAHHRAHGAHAGDHHAVDDEVHHGPRRDASHENLVPSLRQYPLRAHHIGEANEDQRESQRDHQRTGLRKILAEEQRRKFSRHRRQPEGHGAGHAQDQLHGQGNMLAHGLRLAASLHGRHLGQHDRPHGGDKAAQAIYDFFRVFIQAVLGHAADCAHHDLIHGAVHLHGNDRQEQHRAGRQMLQRVSPRHPMEAYPSPDAAPAAQTAYHGAAAPDKAVFPQVAGPAHQQEYARHGHQFHKGISQGNGLELIQPHQQPVQIDQTAHGHQRQPCGDLLFRPRNEADVAHVQYESGSRRQPLHLINFRKGSVKLLLIVLHPGDSTHAVVFQSQHPQQHKHRADRPRVGIQARALLTHRAGQIRGGNNGQQQRKHAIGDIIGCVLSCTQAQAPRFPSEEIFFASFSAFLLHSCLTSYANSITIRKRAVLIWFTQMKEVLP